MQRAAPASVLRSLCCCQASWSPPELRSSRASEGVECLAYSCNIIVIMSKKTRAKPPEAALLALCPSSPTSRSCCLRASASPGTPRAPHLLERHLFAEFVLGDSGLGRPGRRGPGWRRSRRSRRIRWLVQFRVLRTIHRRRWGPSVNCLRPKRPTHAVAMPSTRVPKARETPPQQKRRIRRGSPEARIASSSRQSRRLCGLYQAGQAERRSSKGHTVPPHQPTPRGQLAFLG